MACAVNPSLCSTNCTGGLKYASVQAADLCTRSGDRIVLECDAPDQGICTYPPHVFYGDIGSNPVISRTNVTVIAEPARSVIFSASSIPTTAPIIIDSVMQFAVNATGWTLDGVVIDGRSADIISTLTALNPPLKVTTAHPALSVTSSGITIRNVEVKDSISDCISVQHTGAPGISDVTVENSHIHDCIHWRTPYFTRQENAQGEPLKVDGGTYSDANGIYTYTAKNLVVKDNVIHHTSGDGVQLDVEGANPGRWENVIITGNYIYTSPLASLNGTAPGENGVDGKPGKGPLTVVGNTLHGFRGFNDVTLAGNGTGSDKGGAIIVHGRYTSCATSGTPNPSNNYCALVEGNDISDSNLGIGVGYNQLHSWQGIAGGSSPKAVFVRRNVIHDLSSAANNEADSRAKGHAIRIGNTGDGGVQTIDHLYIQHNTLTKIPGAAIFQSSTNTPCTSCEVKYNLIDNSGPLCSNTPNQLTVAANLCTGNTPSANFCTHTATTAGFVGGSAGGPTSCGDQAFIPDALASYDYRVTASSAAYDHASSDSVDVVCGTKSELGAKEVCGAGSAFPDSKLILRQHASGGYAELGSPDHYRLTSNFENGLGSFADSLQFERPALPGSRCVASNNSTLDSCVFSTGVCSNECSPGILATNELNCSCIKPQKRSFGVVSPSSVFAVDAGLAIDTDRDGRQDSIRLSTSWADYYPLSAVHGQMAFEDFAAAKASGDRDDFIADVSAISCNFQGTAQVSSFLGETQNLTCDAANTCAGNCTANPAPTDLKVKAQILIDSSEIASNAYSEGRSLHVVVSAVVFGSGTAPRRLAICPVLTVGEFQHITREFEYSFDGAVDCAPTTGVPFGSAGRFDCSRAADTATDVPGRVAFSRYQSLERRGGQTTCEPESDGDDLDVVSGSVRCQSVALPTVRAYNFRIRLSDLDLGLGTSLAGLSHAEVSGALKSLRVYVVDNVNVGKFYCPSGFGADFKAVDPMIGNLSVATFNPQLITVLRKP